MGDHNVVEGSVALAEARQSDLEDHGGRWWATTRWSAMTDARNAVPQSDDFSRRGGTFCRWTGIRAVAVARGWSQRFHACDFREAVLGEDQGLVVDLGGLCACGGYMDLQIWIIVVSFSGTLT